MLQGLRITESGAEPIAVIILPDHDQSLPSKTGAMGTDEGLQKPRSLSDAAKGPMSLVLDGNAWNAVVSEYRVAVLCIGVDGRPSRPTGHLADAIATLGCAAPGIDVDGIGSRAQQMASWLEQVLAASAPDAIIVAPQSLPGIGTPEVAAMANALIRTGQLHEVWSHPFLPRRHPWCCAIPADQVAAMQHIANAGVSTLAGCWDRLGAQRLWFYDPVVFEYTEPSLPQHIIPE